MCVCREKDGFADLDWGDRNAPKITQKPFYLHVRFLYGEEIKKFNSYNMHALLLSVGIQEAL